MIIQFFMPKRTVEVNSDTVTDKELAALDMTREGLNLFLSQQPRDLETELDDLKEQLKQKGII